MSGEPRPELSVVVPVYRTAWALPELARRVRGAAREAGLRHELVLVDDASPDDARRVAAELQDEDPAVRLVPLDGNRGQHRAVLAGLAAARGDWVVVMDGDLQDPPEAIPRLLAEGRAGYDAVFASRAGEYQAGHRMATSRLFKRLLARLCGLPRGSGMYFLASRRMVERLVGTADPRPFVVAQVGLAGLPVTGVPVGRAARSRGASAYSEWGRLRAGLAGVAFVLRERRRVSRSDGGRDSPAPGRLRGQAVLWGLLSAVAGFAAGHGRAFGLSDEGFRYLLSRAWAEGEPILRLFDLLYLPGQYAYFGTLLRALGPEVETVRLAEAVLGGAAVAVVVLAVGRVAGPALTGAAGAALAFVTLPGYASVASALVLAAAVDLAVRVSEGRGPGPGWLLGAGLLAGLLAGWREDSAVLALAVALAAVALRRRPSVPRAVLDTFRLVLPGALLGMAAWTALFALRGEGWELLAHLGRRMLFLVGRLDEPTRPGWSFPAAPFASRDALLAALFPFAAAVPPLVYVGVLVRQGIRRYRGRAVRWPAVTAAAVGVAYLPQYLWERPDHHHLWAHLHLLAGVVAVAAAGEGLRGRRLAGAGLVAAALLCAGFVATRGAGEETVPYPCCQGRRIGARIPDSPPPWAGLSRQGDGTFLVLGWGPGWYVVEGVRPPTPFLDPGARSLAPEEIAELTADLADPEVAWVITGSLDQLPPDAIRTLRRLYEPDAQWRGHGWRLWRRLPG